MVWTYMSLSVSASPPHNGSVMCSIQLIRLDSTPRGAARKTQSKASAHRAERGIKGVRISTQPQNKGLWFQPKTRQGEGKKREDCLQALEQCHWKTRAKEKKNVKNRKQTTKKKEKKTTKDRCVWITAGADCRLCTPERRLRDPPVSSPEAISLSLCAEAQVSQMPTPLPVKEQQGDTTQMFMTDVQ